MKPRRHARRWILLAALGSLAGLFYAWYEAGYIRDRVDSQRIASLFQSSRGIDTIEHAGSNAATVAIDAQMFQLLEESLRGQSVSFTTPDLPNEVLTASLSSFDLNLMNGAIAAKLAIRLKSDKRPIWLDANVDGAVYFSGVKELTPAREKKSPVYAAQFRIMPEVVALTLKSRIANLSLGVFSDIAAANAIRFLSKRLTISVPFEPRVGLAIDGEHDFVQKFGDDSSGLAKIAVRHPEIDVHRWIHVASPIFSEHGVILAATISPDKAQPFDVSEAVVANFDVSGAERKLMEKLPGLLARFSGKHLTIDVGAGAINDIAASVADVARSLKVDVALTEISGKLFNKEWSFPIVGRQNAYGEIPGGGRSSGSINIPAVELGYAAGSGLSGSIDLSAAGKSPVHIKVNSFARLGTTVEIQGSGSARFKARLMSSVIAFEGSQVPLVGPVIECAALVVAAKTNGKFELGQSWARVPSLGATFGFLVGKKPFEPTVAFRPMVVRVLTSSDESDRYSEVTFPKGLYLNLAPQSVSFDPGDGRYRIALQVQLEATNVAPDAKSVKERDERLDSAVEAYWNEAMKSACPEVPALRVQVGDLEIGPNGEIAKALLSAWKDITKGPGSGNEAVKILEMLDRGKEHLDDAGRQSLNDAILGAQGVFPNDEVIQRLVRALPAIRQTGPATVPGPLPPRTRLDPPWSPGNVMRGMRF